MRQTIIFLALLRLEASLIQRGTNARLAPNELSPI